MIRINLLNGREGAHGATAAQGSSPFLAKWRVWAGVACGLVAISLVAMTLRTSDDGQDRVEAASAPGERKPQPVERAPEIVRPDPVAVEVPAARPSPPRSSPAAGGRIEQSTTSSGDTPEVQTNLVTTVTATPAEGGINVFFGVQGQPNFRVIEVDGPTRLAVDIEPARVTIDPENRASDLDHPLVTRILVAQNELDPPRVRAVIEVSSFPAVNGRVDENGITLELRGRN